MVFHANDLRAFSPYYYSHLGLKAKLLIFIKKKSFSKPFKLFVLFFCWLMLMYLLTLWSLDPLYNRLLLWFSLLSSMFFIACITDLFSSHLTRYDEALDILDQNWATFFSFAPNLLFFFSSLNLH